MAESGVDVCRPLAEQERAKAKAEKKKGKRRAKKPRHRIAPSLAKKEAELTEKLGHDEAYKAKLPAAPLVQVALALFAQSYASVPLNCSTIILPIMLATIDAYGYRGKLHSKQPDFPVDSLKDIGATFEAGKPFLSKRWVNKFVCVWGRRCAVRLQNILKTSRTKSTLFGPS